MFQKSENVRWQVDGLCELLVILDSSCQEGCLICSSDVMSKSCCRVVE